MIRSRSIPPVLSRAAGDGIHAILLIDADGELLGSYGSPPPLAHQQKHQKDSTMGDAPSAANNAGGGGSGNHDKSSPSWPLDAASIGALVSEVAGDYRRMGEELLLLDPHYDSTRHHHRASDGGDLGGVDKNGEGGGGRDDGRRDGSPSDELDGEGGMGPSSGLQRQQSGAGDKTDKDKLHDSGTNLKSLVIELDYGIVGIASAGPDFYVIALADSTVQHGALNWRLRALGSHVREALSQLE